MSSSRSHHVASHTCTAYRVMGALALPLACMAGCLGMGRLLGAACEPGIWRLERRRWVRAFCWADGGRLRSWGCGCRNVWLASCGRPGNGVADSEEAGSAFGDGFLVGAVGIDSLGNTGQRWCCEWSGVQCLPCIIPSRSAYGNMYSTYSTAARRRPRPLTGIGSGRIGHRSKIRPVTQQRFWRGRWNSPGT
ncbi:hypothetical protein EDC01DRAFT_390661 [Geopyxis carbonaria]|nr:hypothetical protein EDC01DRAFT_390661 [Geopyxis carbonaria]